MPTDTNILKGGDFMERERDLAIEDAIRRMEWEGPTRPGSTFKQDLAVVFKNSRHPERVCIEASNPNLGLGNVREQVKP